MSVREKWPSPKSRRLYSRNLESEQANRQSTEFLRKEVFLQDAMEELMIESDTESLTDDSDAENLVQVLQDEQKQDKKRQNRSK